MGEPNVKAGEFLDLFGGDQIMAELIDLIDCPSFAAAWNRLCEKWATDKKWHGYTKMRMMAFRANATHDPEMKQQAWQMMMESLSANGHDRFPADPVVIKGPEVAEPVQELAARPDTPGVSQWALNILTTMELARR